MEYDYKLIVRKNLILIPRTMYDLRAFKSSYLSSKQFLLERAYTYVHSNVKAAE